MARDIVLALGAVFYLACAESGVDRLPSTRAVVTFYRDGHTLVLDDLARDTLVARVQRLTAGCGINSLSEPGNFTGLERYPAVTWARIRGGPHIQIRYPKPFEVARRPAAPCRSPRCWWAWAATTSTRSSPATRTP